MSGIYIASGAKILPPRYSSQGAAAGFSPLDLSPTLWFRADTGSVSSWTDQSANAKHAVQADSGKQPAITASNASFNNQSTYDFTVGDFLQTPSLGAAQTQPYTLYICFLASAGTFVTDGLDATHRVIPLISGGTLYLHAGAYGVQSTTNPNAKHVWCGVVNGGSSAWYVDKYNTTEDTGDAGAHTFSGLTIGAGWDGGSGVTASIPEIAIFAGSHSSGNRQSMMEYMGTRYGVTITA
jgi:hypothetical protein